MTFPGTMTACVKIIVATRRLILILAVVLLGGIPARLVLFVIGAVDAEIVIRMLE